MNSALPITVAKESSQTATTFNAANAVKMLARFKGNMANAAWFMNQDVLPQLPMMTVATSPCSSPVEVLPMPRSVRCSGVQSCRWSLRNSGTKGDIILADFSEYMP